MNEKNNQMKIKFSDIENNYKKEYTLLKEEIINARKMNSV